VHDDDNIVGPDWLGTTEAAHYLGLTPRTLYRLIDDGALPAYRIGRVIRVRVADLDDYIEASRIVLHARLPLRQSKLTARRRYGD
jgi:excisionase family DNA binding protein